MKQRTEDPTSATKMCSAHGAENIKVARGVPGCRSFAVLSHWNVMPSHVTRASARGAGGRGSIPATSWRLALMS